MILLLSASTAQASHNTQITICHGGSTIQVSSNAVAGHFNPIHILFFNDYLGPCNSSSSTSSSSASEQSSSSSTETSQSSSDTSSISFSSSDGSDTSSSISSLSSSSDNSESSISSSSSSWESSTSSSVSSFSVSSSDSSLSSSSQESSQSSASVYNPGNIDMMRSHSRDGHGGACRGSQPWCKEWAKSGQYPLWFPSWWSLSDITYFWTTHMHWFSILND